MSLIGEVMGAREPVATRMPLLEQTSAEEIEASLKGAEQRSPRSSAHADYVKHAAFLSRKLARYYCHIQQIL
jgi:hypothetical protein